MMRNKKKKVGKTSFKIFERFLARGRVSSAEKLVGKFEKLFFIYPPKKMSREKNVSQQVRVLSRVMASVFLDSN